MRFFLSICFSVLLIASVFAQGYPATQVTNPVNTYAQNDTKGVWVLGMGSPTFTPTSKKSNLYFDIVGQRPYAWDGDEWINWTADYIDDVSNGLHRIGSTVLLGGALQEETTIDLNENDLHTTGNGTIWLESDNDVLINSGVNDGTGTVFISAGSTVTVNANDAVELNSVGNTTISSGGNTSLYSTNMISVYAPNDISISTGNNLDMTSDALFRVNSPEVVIRSPSWFYAPIGAPFVKIDADGQLDFAEYAIDVTGISDGDMLVYDEPSATFLPSPVTALDDQTLSINGGDISISNGNTISLPDDSPTNELQSLSLSGNLLGLSGSGTVDLSAITSSVFIATNGLELSGTDLGVLDFSSAQDGTVPVKNGNAFDWNAPIFSINHGATLTGDGNATPLDVLAIGSAQITNGSITNADLGSTCVNTTQLVDGSVTGSKIAALTITGGKIASATITQSKMANNSIGSAQIIANDIQYNDIAPGAVRTATILDHTITTSDLSDLGASEGQIMQLQSGVWTPIDFPIQRNQQFTATANQTTFTLTYTPIQSTGLQFFKDGILIPRLAYSLTGNVVTYIPAQNGNVALTSGNRINIFYQK